MEHHYPSAVQALDALIDELHRQGRLRVWSLAITIFGDAVSPRGGTVALSVLQDIMQRLRIEPGALRTAMSRLAAEGWVDRHKKGRLSFYRFEGKGRHAFDQATRRIYASGPPDWQGDWTIAIGRPGETVQDETALRDAGFEKIAGTVFLRAESEPEECAVLAGMLVFRSQAEQLPDWISALWPLSDINAAYSALNGQFRPLHLALEAGGELAGIDAMAARTLLIHHWRRIVLRDPGLPAALLPKDWTGEAARDQVRRIYAHLGPASEQWLDGAGLGRQTDRAAFSRRFGG